MSASPPKAEGVEAVDGTPDNTDEQLDARDGEGGRDAAFADFDLKEQDRWLPIANVARIMKAAVPDNAKISKEAKECVQECVSEFISFITSEASEKCHQEKRKTVNGEDILFAMTSLGFENYAEALKIYLSKYREIQSTRTDNGGRPGTGYEGNGEGIGSGTADGNADGTSAFTAAKNGAGGPLMADSVVEPGVVQSHYTGVYPGDVGNGHTGSEQPY